MRSKLPSSAKLLDYMTRDEELLNETRVRIVRRCEFSIEEFVKMGGSLVTNEIVIAGEVWLVENMELNLRSSPEADIPGHLGKVQLVLLAPII